MCRDGGVHLKAASSAFLHFELLACCTDRISRTLEGCSRYTVCTRRWDRFKAGKSSRRHKHTRGSRQAALCLWILPVVTESWILPFCTRSWILLIIKNWLLLVITPNRCNKDCAIVMMRGQGLWWKWRRGKWRPVVRKEKIVGCARFWWCSLKTQWSVVCLGNKRQAGVGRG